MRILSVQALRGANFWSTINTKLIQVRLEIDCDVYNDKKSLALLNKINFLTIDCLQKYAFVCKVQPILE
jgi:hypothetical protein